MAHGSVETGTDLYREVNQREESTELWKVRWIKV